MDKSVAADAINHTVAADFLTALWDHGIEYVFANPGTDFAPIIEALVAFSQQGRPTPKFVTVPHENVAIAMAQGYYQIARKPAAVMVHVTVGTANTICGLMNANRDYTPVLMMAGRTPLTETGSTGARNNQIHWGQENFDQGGMVREQVKWDYELRSGQPVRTIIGRALDIAMTEPMGPVYLTLPREVLAETVSADQTAPRERAVGTPPPVANADAIEQAAKLFANAEKPLIVAGRVGFRPAAFDVLGGLAADFGLPIVQVNGPALSSDHPANFGFVVNRFLPDADLVMVVECPVPWVPRVINPQDKAKLIHLSPDPHFSGFPFRGFEMDVALAGEPVETLRQLHGALAVKTFGRESAIMERKNKIKETHLTLVAEKEEILAKAATSNPILPPWVAACINDAKSDDAISINELGINIDHIHHTGPGNYVGGGAAGGLGFGLGSALGAKLAAPDREVILTVGNGSYIFGNPTPAHFVGVAENLPTLTIIMNNEQWFAVHRATKSMYPDGVAAKANEMPLVDLKPSPQFHAIMEACGGYGECVENPDDLPGAMKRALDKVRNGTPALLNVMTAPGGRD